MCALFSILLPFKLFCADLIHSRTLSTQVRYNFSIPRVKEVQPESLNGPSIHLGAIAYPVTPLPALLRYLQPKPLGQNEESINLRGYDTKFLSRTSREMITLYGTAFKKDPNKSDSSWELFFGTCTCRNDFLKARKPTDDRSVSFFIFHRSPSSAPRRVEMPGSHGRRSREFPRV